ncbi:hypothetical protein BC835DRAFT_1416096 [Cytidiella melzeri]|nr:hypothetical protein BC835DRAFT_1416096 [Cytidiella melzeri]
MLPSGLVYDVQPTLTATLGLIRPANPPAERRLPELWTYAAHHPQRPQLGSTTGRTFVFFIDTTPNGKAKWDAIADSLEIPHGVMGDVLQSHPAWTKLEAGDYIFARDYAGMGRPENDILMIWVGNPNILADAAEMHAELNAAREPILGDPNLRTSTQVAYERADWPKEVSQDGRCYSIGQTVERPRNSDAPPAASKIFDGQPSEMHHHQAQLLRAVSRYTVRMYEQQAPQAPQIALRRWRDMINVPRIGHDDNFYFDAFQLNLAPASATHSQATLAKLMGARFGAPHRDQGDSPFHLSSMTVLSDLPSDYDPGRFYVLAIGVFVELTPLLNVYFCGRLRHGGTPPLAPHGQEPISSAYRMVVIAYPPSRIASGETRHALAAINPDGDPLYLSPEMTGVSLDNLAQNQRANAAADGLMTMHPKSLCRFYFRAMAQLTATLLGQLPADLNVHFDREAYLKSITAHLSDGMFSAEGFDLGPNGFLHQPDAAVVAQRLAVRKAVTGDLFNHHAPAIPDVVTPIPTAQDDCEPGRIQGRPRRSGVIQSSGITKAKAVDRTAATKTQLRKQVQTSQLSQSWGMSMHTPNCLNAAQRLNTSAPKPAQPKRCVKQPARRRKLRPVVRSPAPDGYSSTDHPIDGALTPFSRLSPALHAYEPSQTAPINAMYVDSPDAVQDAMQVDETDVNPLSMFGSPSWSSAQPLDIAALDQALGRVVANPVAGRLHKRGTPERRRATQRTAHFHNNVDDEEESLQDVSDTEDDNPDDPDYMDNQYLNNTRSNQDLANNNEVDDEDDGESDDDGDSDDDDGGLDEILCGHRGVSNNADGRELSRQKWFQCVTVSSVHAANDAVIQARADMQGASKETLVDVINQMDAIVNSVPAVLSESSIDDSVIDRTQKFAEHLTQLRAFTNHTRVWLTACQSRIMVSETILWMHIVGACKQRINVTVLCLHGALTEPQVNAHHATQPPVVESQPLPRLCQHVLDRFMSAGGGVQKPVEIPSRSFFPQLEPQVFVMEFPRRLLTGTDLCTHTVDTVVNILRSWFGVPRTFHTDARCDFMSLLVRHVGWGMCMLESTWVIYEKMPFWLFNDKIRPVRKAGKVAKVAYVPGSMSNFADALSRSVLATRTSQVFRLLYHLPNQYELLVQAACDFVHHPAKRTAHRQARLDLLNPSTAKTNLNAPTPQPLPAGEGAMHMVDFLRNAYALRNAHNNDVVEGASPVQQVMLSNLDFFMPLRDDAPTRRAVLRGIHPSVARTTSGLFSMMLVRLVTFNTVPLTDRNNPCLQVEFADLEAFDTWLARMRTHYKTNDDSFFCNKQAFSRRPLKQRVLANKAKIWDVAQKCSWEHRDAVAFGPTWSWLLKLKGLPGFGKLTKYLLLADLCGASAVHRPTVEEMGSVIHTLNTGAIDGLRRLQYLDPTSERRPPLPPCQLSSRPSVNSLRTCTFNWAMTLRALGGIRLMLSTVCVKLIVWLARSVIRP